MSILSLASKASFKNWSVFFFLSKREELFSAIRSCLPLALAQGLYSGCQRQVTCQSTILEQPSLCSVQLSSHTLLFGRLTQPRPFPCSAWDSLQLAQLYQLVLFLKKFSEFGVALGHKVENQFAAVIVKQPRCSNRETYGLEGRRKVEVNNSHPGINFCNFKQAGITNEAALIWPNFSLGSLFILAYGIS